MQNRSIALGSLALLALLAGVYWLLIPDVKRSAPGVRTTEAAALRPAAATAADAAKPEAGSDQGRAGDSKAGEGKAAEGPEKVPQAVAAVAKPAAPAARAPSFRDNRGIDAPAEPKASETKPSETKPNDKAAEKPAEKPPAGFRDERALDTPSFKDERLAGADQKDTPPPSFHDERAITQPSFRDERTVETAPSFKDDRIASADAAKEAPSFRDDRMAAADAGGKETPSFRDDRIAAAVPERGAPSFRDERLVTTTPNFKDDRLATPATPSFRDDRLVGDAVPAGDADGAMQVAAAGTALRIDPAKCGQPEVSGDALDGGRMNVRAHAACFANQTVRIAYGGAELIRTLDSNGNLDFTLDCFAGTSSAVEVRFPDGTKKSTPAVAYELDKVSKIAVVWRTPVNLDLHVFEYAARFGQPGHIWAKTPSTLAAARSASRGDHRGHGFLSSVDSEENPGDKIEVYTFLHDDEQTSGAIGLALDYETRGETPGGATCGNGAQAEVDFQVVVLPRGGNPARHSGVLTRVECGVKLPADVRFSQSALPSLRIRK